MSKTKEEIIKIWKELGVNEAQFIFDCGGDEMGNTEIELFDEEGNAIQSDDINEYIDDVIYHHVDFYEASDGYYQGEFGTVYIRLTDEGDEFSWDKESECELLEPLITKTEIELTDDEITYIKDKVKSIHGEEYDIQIEHKTNDVTDSEKEFDETLKETLKNFLWDYVPNSEYEGELDYGYYLSTNFEKDEDGEEIFNEMVINGNKLTVMVQNNTRVIRYGEW